MKTLPIITLLFSLPGLALASIPLGKGDVTLGISGGATYDSNLSGAQNGPSDVYGTVTPRADYVRNSGLLQATGDLSVSVLRYYSDTQFNAENIDSDLNLKLAEDVGQKLTGGLAAGYHENSGVDADLNARQVSKTASLTAQGSLITGPRTQLGFTGSFSNLDHSIGSNQQSIAAGSSFAYQGFLNDTTATVSYDYNHTHSSGDNIRGVDLNQSSNQVMASLSRPLYRDVTGRVGVGYRILDRSKAETALGDSGKSSPVYSAGIDGPFLPRKYFPKIKSSFSISYEDASTPGINDPGSKSIAGSLHLTWEARAKSTISLDATRSQRLTATDLTAVTSIVSAGLKQSFTHNVTGQLMGSYSWNNFRAIDRSDKRTSINGSLSYAFAHGWSAVLSYEFDIIDSSAPMTNYNHHIVSTSITYHF